jgi:hypothetical protein
VIAFALLKQSGEAIRGDLLSGISILLRPIVTDLGGKLFESGLLAKRIADAYGMDIPATVLEDLMEKLVSAKVLEIDDSTGSKRVIYADSDGASSQKVDARDEEQIQTILDSFLEHARKQLAGQVEISEESLLSGFLQRLSTMEFSAAKTRPLVSAAPTSKTLEGPTARSLRAMSAQLESEATLDIVVASFISQIEISRPADLDLISRIADGALAAELVLDLRAPTAVSKFQETVAIIDTPTLMSYLNLSSRSDHEAAKAMFARLQASGAKIAAFQHSIEEAEGILAAVRMAGHLGNSAYGPIKRRMESSPGYRSYFDTVIERLASIWKETHHFEIIQGTSNHYYVNFSTDDEESLFSALRPIFGEKVAQGQKDAKSVAETMRRLAKAHVSLDRVQTCRYVFVTSNAAFQRIAERFLKDNKYVLRGEFTPVVTDRYMAGLCWLICGGSSENAPSRVRLIANCSAALRTRPEIVDRTKRFLQDLDPDLLDHFEAVMTNDRASQYLVETTLGNPEAITANNISAVLQGMERRLTEQVAREKDEHYAGTISQLRAEIDRGTVAQSQLQERLAQLDLDKESATRDAESLRGETTRLTEGNERLQTAVQQQSEQIGALSSAVNSLSQSEQALRKFEERRRKQAEASATIYADKWMRRMQWASVLTPLLLIGVISYFDKFVLEGLDDRWKETGKWSFVVGQIILGVASASFIVDALFSKRMEKLKVRRYKQRLLELGYSDEAEATEPVL